ncbi:transporter particle subunit bet5 [Aureobasidium pullulans]|nr:transporter particle subunit bet5 [Aureobasidium pullulans]TIA31921.1 transporter particle subunit bet5 [Aureobasidium pullulans]
MTVYSFYIFDRHTECIYSKRWAQRPVSQSARSVQRQSGASAISNGDLPGVNPKALSNEDDAKLIFGAIFSLRRMVRQLGGEDDSFLSYRTGEYKLHYFETATNLKFVMLTDTRIASMRTVLYQIWANLYVEYVVKSPISPVEHAGGVGVANELFEGALESFINTSSEGGNIKYEELQLPIPSDMEDEPSRDRATALFSGKSR